MANAKLRNFRALMVASCMLLSAGPAAATMISDRYDGNYVGAATVARELSSPACAPLPLAHLEIRNGILRAYEYGGRQIVKGLVTHDGFFTSDYIFADGRTTLFEGLVDRQGEFSGGIVDGPCIWVVKMLKSQR